MRYKDFIEIIGDMIFDYSQCDSQDTECPKDCNFHGCQMYKPVVYKRN